MSAKREAPVVKATEAIPMVYIGPTIPGVVFAGTIFNNGYPEKLKDEVKKTAAIKTLLVPVTELKKARQELKRQGSAVQVCYEKIRRAKG